MKNNLSTFAYMSLALCLAIFLVLAGCTSPDIEELKKGQQDILARLKALEEKIEKSKGPQRKRPEIDYSKVYNIPVGESGSRGASAGKVTIAEFSDIQCPYCNKFQPLILQILDAYPNDVTHVFKNFPLRFHKQARPAALALLAAKKQGKFWELQKHLFENARSLSDEKIKELAGQVGLDVARFEADMKDEATTKILDKEIAEAKAAAVRGTPSVFVNGKRVKERTFDGMKAMIEEALKGGASKGAKKKE